MHGACLGLITHAPKKICKDSSALVSTGYPHIGSNQQSSRKGFLTVLTTSCAALLPAGIPGASLAVENSAEESPTEAVARETRNVEACPKTTEGSNNCVSTASVRQLDLYMPPWTYPKDMPKKEVIARIKGAVSTNIRLDVVEESEDSLKVQAIRNFCKDEILFLVNENDHVVTFVSKQVDGPDSPDFGENRKRLEDIRRRVGVFGVMGEDFSDMQGQKEGALGQLKAFYGLRSGRGFEDVLLDEDD